MSPSEFWASVIEAQNEIARQLKLTGSEKADLLKSIQQASRGEGRVLRPKPRKDTT
jgi:hypothetical protein